MAQRQIPNEAERRHVRDCSATGAESPDVSANRGSFVSQYQQDSQHHLGGTEGGPVENRGDSTGAVRRQGLPQACDRETGPRQYRGCPTSVVVGWRGRRCGTAGAKHLDAAEAPKVLSIEKIIGSLDEVQRPFSEVPVEGSLGEAGDGPRLCNDRCWWSLRAQCCPRRRNPRTRVLTWPLLCCGRRRFKVDTENGSTRLLEQLQKHPHALERRVQNRRT